VTHLVLGLAVILMAAKVAGELTERFLKQPSVLGELIAGMIIGPHLLGGVDLPLVGRLFHAPAGTESFIPVSPELWAVAQVAAVILLFIAGLETDLRQFLRFAPQATLVALGGVVLPFVLGAYGAVLFGGASNILEPMPLFMGAVMTATSVGITARILADIQKINTPEGVTILAGAVVDDVLGILVLTVVVGVAAAGGISTGTVAVVAAKAVGFWLGLTALGIAGSRYISRFLLAFRSAGASLALALGLAFLAAALAEEFGLAMIIGAYSIGLALSTTEVKEHLAEPLQAVGHALVPSFFVVMGMLVDFSAMGAALIFGVAITILAIIGKLAGCALPALAAGFNRTGAWRIGVGMLPRGEVALIVAGVGLSRGIIGPDVFGVAILMTVVTTFLAPILLVPAFRSGGPGLRRPSVARPVRTGEGA
jgi:Kef-type K+ transport system membrane component KefB